MRWRAESAVAALPLFTRDGCGALFEPALDDIRVDDEALAATPQADWPQCPNCGGAARPNVYLFGDGTRFVDNPAV